MHTLDWDIVYTLDSSVVRLRNVGLNIGNVLPAKIANEMVSIISDDWFVPKDDELVSEHELDLDVYTDNHRVLDLCCNSGMLLYHFMKKFFYVLCDYTNFKKTDDCYEYILKNLLYGVSTGVSICEMVRELLYKDDSVLGNIYNYDVFSRVINIDKSDNIIRSCSDDDSFEIKDGIVYIYDSDRKGKVPMKFNVVCGNPPYNKEVYEDFLKLGYNLTSRYVCMITPAKWGSRERSRELRSLIVPKLFYIKKFVTSYDVFNITCWGGLTIVGIDKETTSDCFDVTTYSSKTPYFNGTYKEVRDKDTYSFDYFGECNILPKLGSYEIFESRYDRHDSYFFHVANTFSYTNFLKLSPGSDSILSTLEVNEDSDFHKNDMIVYSSGSRGSCDSVLSYFKTRFVRYLMLLGMNIQNPFHRGTDLGETNKNSLRYVPMIDNFNCVYDDKHLAGYTPNADGTYIDSNGIKHCSLYAKYGLTDYEIEVIESVVKGKE